MFGYIDAVVIVALVLLLAGVKSLHFRPNQLSDFELKRRVAAGDEQAIGEQRLRRDWPEHQALQRLVAVWMTGGITAFLLARHGFVAGGGLALLALALAEALSANRWLGRWSEWLVIRFRPQLCGLVDVLHPLLKLIAYRHQTVARQSMRFYSPDELLQAVEASGTILDPAEKRALTQALVHRTKIMRQVMTPRSELLLLNPEDTLGPVLLDQLHKSGQTRFLVQDPETKQIVGTLDTRDVMPLRTRAAQVQDAMNTQLAYLHQDQPLGQALQAFLQTGCLLFMVVNESAETTGVITIEDILWQLTGQRRGPGFDQYHDLRAVAGLAGPPGKTK